MDQIYKELLDSFEQIGEPDDKAEEFIDDIREDIEGLAKDYTEDESSEFRLSNILADDDYLLEELTDRVAYLNFVEANTGGKIAESGVSKEDLENAYLSVIDSLFELSKSITPLGGFGKDRLEAGLSLIRNFEDIYWPIATRIVPENAEAFSDLISDENYDDILVGRKRAIGALRHVDGKVCAAGAIVYTVFEGTQDSDPAFKLDWVEVHEDLRGKGIGNFLMAQFLELVLQREGTGAYVEFPIVQTQDEAEREALDVLGNFLDSWGFAFSILDSGDFVIKISEVKDNKYFEKRSLKGKSLYALGAKGADLLRDFFDSMDNDHDEDIKALPYDYFDPDVSSVILEGGKIRSVFLVHRMKNGNYRYEALRGDKKNISNDAIDLLALAYKACVSVEDDDNMIYGSFDSEEGFEMIKKLVPSGRMLMKFRGVMFPPEPEEVITSEEWDTFRETAGFSNEKIPEKGLDDDGIGKKELAKILKMTKGYLSQE